ncbi:MAG: addiction module antitoxin RelB [Candidatus Entotheonella gemina]|uniref:Addiction module antitoxin RelB n=1 Tax=Candidatus Entotheonella gemina TaxID=1429439 RepID=W4M9N6_9BACT|nr:MAG: addiction module antitoxin RelB [Candidatus Entotheonella gemina]
MAPKRVEHEALRMPPEERTKLAQKLLLSLEALSEEELEQAWLVEADRRARELDRDEVRPVPAEEVRRKTRMLLR